MLCFDIISDLQESGKNSKEDPLYPTSPIIDFLP